MIARASPTRFRMPPDNSEGFLSSIPGNSTISSASVTFRFISVSGRPSRRSGKPTFSATVIESNSAAPWNSMPNLCRTRSSSRSFRPQMFSPSINTSPSSGHNNPMICLSRTLFPPPLRPIMATDSPVSTLKLTPSSTTRPPKLFFNRFTSIIQMQQPAQQQCQEKIADQNRYRGIYHRLCRRPPHSFRPFAGAHPFITADDRHNPAKNERLADPCRHVHAPGIFHHVVIRIRRINPQIINPHQIPGDNPDQDGFRRQQRQRYD